MSTDSLTKTEPLSMYGSGETGSARMTRYDPPDIESLWKFAKIMANSTMVSKGLRGKPEDIMAVVMRGNEMGLTSQQSLQTLYVIDGKVGMDASLIRARCMAHPDCLQFQVVEATPTKAVISVQKRGDEEPSLVQFTIDDAKAAGLIRGGSGWEKWAADMMVARATTRAARWHFPSVIVGVFEVEELKQIVAEEQKTTEVAAKVVEGATALDAIVERHKTPEAPPETPPEPPVDEEEGGEAETPPKEVVDSGASHGPKLEDPPLSRAAVKRITKAQEMKKMEDRVLHTYLADAFGTADFTMIPKDGEMQILKFIDSAE